MNNAKRLFLKLHRYAGLTVALLLLAQGLSGALLVFRDDITPLIHPALRVSTDGAHLPAQRLLDTVRAAHPDATITSVDMPSSNSAFALFRLTDRDGALRLTAVDPANARIVHDGTLTAWPEEWLFYFHESLLAGDTGELVIGLEGVLLAFMAISGLVAWWPGRRRLRQGFTVRFDRGSDWGWRSLHRAMGAALAPLLLTSALTGSLMVWKAEVRTALKQVMPVAEKPKPSLPDATGTPVPLDRLIALAQAHHGATPVQQVRFFNKGRLVAIYLESNRSIRPRAASQIYFDTIRGVEAGNYISGELPAASEFIDWLYPIHVGAVGALPLRVLVAMEGLGLAALAATGPYLWYRRRRMRRSSRKS